MTGRDVALAAALVVGEEPVISEADAKAAPLVSELVVVGDQHRFGNVAEALAGYGVTVTFLDELTAIPGDRGVTPNLVSERCIVAALDEEGAPRNRHERRAANKRSRRAFPCS